MTTRHRASINNGSRSTRVGAATRLLAVFAGAACLALAAPPTRPATAVAARDAAAPIVPAVDPGFATGHLLVQLAPGVSFVVRGGELVVEGDAVRGLDATVRRAMRDARVSSARSIFIEPPKDAVTAARLGLDRWQRVELARGADAAAARARLSALVPAAFSAVELDPAGGLADLPNDTDFGQQYALQNTGQVIAGSAGVPGADVAAPGAWTYTTGDPDLVIAVLDSGITPHPELTGRILPGINVPDGNTTTLDECNHGTHVAGILAAAGNNGAGIAGMTWNARLLPVVVVNGCTGFESNVATGLTWAVDQGARLVNMSLQFNTGSAVFLQAIQYAHAQGALLVAATGNSGGTAIAAPARWNETIAVGATDNRDIRASFSNYGAELDVVAPGVSVYSLNPPSGYQLKNGTSMATPHVTGLGALLWSYNPSLTRDQVRALIESGVDDLGAPGDDDFFGFGRIDASRSLQLAPPPYAPEDLNRDGDVNAQDLAILLAAWGPCADCDGGCAADFDGNCTVGATDLARLLDAF